MIRALVVALALLPALAFGNCNYAPKGTGTPLDWGINANGVWANWWCKDNYSVTQHLYVLRFDGMKAEMISDLAKVSEAEDVLAEIRLRMPKHWTLPVDHPDMLAVWGPDDERIWSTRPEPPIWRVLPNTRSADLSRPMQLLTGDGALGSASYDRAAASALCDCRVRVVSGNYTYCAVPPIMNAVAVCRRDQ